MMNYSSTFCLRFDYGLPLDDIFPPNDIHPKLKKLLLHAYFAVKNIGSPIEDILQKCQVPLHARLDIKESIIESQHVDPSNIPAGTYLWLIRHFLGLLPVPLLPKYTHDQHFRWDEISSICKMFFQEEMDEENEDEINNLLCRYICKLPRANLIFLHPFFMFLRSLCSRRNSAQVSRRDSFCVVKYFTQSIFLRPFRPGFLDELEQNYYPLMLYLLLKWPILLKQIKENGHGEIYIHLRSAIEVSEDFTLYNGSDVSFAAKSHGSTQTIRLVESDSIQNSINFYGRESHNMKDSSSQTEHCETEAHFNMIPLVLDHVSESSDAEKKLKPMTAPKNHTSENTKKQESRLSEYSNEVEIRTIEYEDSIGKKPSEKTFINKRMEKMIRIVSRKRPLKGPLATKNQVLSKESRHENNTASNEPCYGWVSRNHDESIVEAKDPVEEKNVIHSSRNSQTQITDRESPKENTSSVDQSNYGWTTPNKNESNAEEKFMYDDYDTFATEEFNQIPTLMDNQNALLQSEKSSYKSGSINTIEDRKKLLSKISRIGWCYSSSNDSGTMQAVKLNQERELSYLNDEDANGSIESELDQGSDDINRSGKKKFNKLKHISSRLSFMKYIQSDRNISCIDSDHSKSSVKYTKMTSK